MRAIDADALAEFLKDAVKRQKYDDLNIDGLLTVADVIEAIISELNGTSLDGFKNAPTIELRCENCEAFNKTRLLIPQPERKKGRWIPCSERLPENIRPVIVTWKNTDPASYYQYIVGKHFTGTACYKNGKWYWYSSTTEDMLAEYGRYDSEEFDEAIECIAWMPLPEPYKEGEGC
jgi:hypothetical protein